MIHSGHHTSIQSSGSRTQVWFRAVIAISCGLLIPHLAAAAEKGPYLGVSIGYSNLDGSVDDINSFSGIANPSETTLSTEGTAYSLFGGFRFNRYIAIEGGIERLGSYDYHIGYRQAFPCILGCAAIAYPPGDFNTPVNIIKVQARGSWPVSDNWSLDAAAGVAKSPMKSDDPFLVTNAYASVSVFVSTYNLLLNAGASLKVSRHWWTRLEFSYLAGGDGPPLGTGDVQTIRLAAEYRFFRE